jgi:Ca2+-binding RTX toxin-like protein
MRFSGLGRRRGIGLGAAAAVAALALPASASAGTVSITGSTLTYSANGGEANDLIIEKDTSQAIFRVIDNTAPATAGAGCTQRAAHRVNCPTTGINLVEVFARDEDDTVQTLIGFTDAHLNGGSGTDDLTSDAGHDTLIAGRNTNSGFTETLNGGASGDVLIGTTSSSTSDSLNGGPGADQLLGGPGFDSLAGDLGTDDIQGGDGSDFYSPTGAAGVTITLDDVANDGEPGENDNVHSDIEEVFGTSFDDTLIGSANNDTFFGFGGDDTLIGAGGNDTLIGSNNMDTLEGDAGNDVLSGGSDADDLVGGPGADDSADYSDHSNPVTVTINNTANDGEAGENDNVHTDVEDLVGGTNDDTLTGSTGNNNIQGQGGADIVNGIGGDDDLYGDFLFNTVTGGNDTLNGGNGDDRLLGGAGADDMTGGNDFDFADYAGFGSNPRTITIDDVANDGEAGENDNVHSGVEGVVGGGGADTITGNSGPNSLQGGLGTDTLHGAGGNDLLVGDQCCVYAADDFDGGTGEDTVSYREHFFNNVTVDIDGVADDGGSGGAEGDNVETSVEDLIGSEGPDLLTGNGANNTIAGRGGTDTLTGGAGGDTLAGNAGPDTSNGDAGKDEINSRNDGFVDTDNCGTEADVAVADSGDTVNADCETRIP